MLNISNVSKTFGYASILNQINITVQKSSIIGLAGPSGCGKSTLLRCIQKLETIDSGSIKLNGTTGFIFQDFQLFPHMTILQNLIYAPSLIKKNMNQNFKKIAISMLSELGIASKANEYPCKLSGGQKQRAALARSLIMHPDILLCDEPTSGLDIATTNDVVVLLESVRAKDVTMLIASHDLDFLTKIADRILVLKNSRINIDIEPKTIKDPISFLKQYY